MFKVKHILNRINGKLNITEQKMCKLEDITIKNHPNEKQKKRIFKNEQSIHELWDNIEQPNIWVIEYPRRTERTTSTTEKNIERKHG